MPLEGRLLISKPAFHDDSFSGTIIFLVEHDDGGSVGLILNRPTEQRVAEAYEEWAPLAENQITIFSGGPVHTDATVVLADGSFDDGDLALGLRSVDFETQVALMRADGVERIRVFNGYAGWGPGQLESEIASGAWWLVEATKDDVFCAAPENLWSSVLRRNGPELAWFAHYPNDPSQN